MFVFRQLLIDGDKKFLKSINQLTSELSIIQIAKKDDIIAKLIETRVVLQ